MLDQFSRIVLYTGTVNIAAALVIAVVALEHVYFAVLEMFLFTKPLGRKIFGTTESFANEAAKLAKNQGLYNLFLTAGLAWSLVAGEGMRRPLAIFFLSCVVIAGLYGGATVSKRIAVFQAAPALLGLVLVLV